MAKALGGLCAPVGPVPVAAHAPIIGGHLAGAEEKADGAQPDDEDEQGSGKFNHDALPVV